MSSLPRCFRGSLLRGVVRRDTLEDAPRVLDTDLGRALGMAKPEDIRRTVNANRQELKELGIIAHTAINTGKRGAPGTAFYLNEEQATYVTMHAKTPKAREVEVLVVRVFTAWRRGGHIH